VKAFPAPNPLRIHFSADGQADGPENMARDLELLDQAEQGEFNCRLYGWRGAWVSLGRFQSGFEAVVDGFDRVVSRPTGGKAVLHGHDLTVALTLPLYGKSVKEAYQRAAAPLIEALNRCGAESGLAGDSGSLLSPSQDCFASVSQFDLRDHRTGVKFAGAAMRLGKSSLLLQASIPFTQPLIDPGLAIVGAAPFQLVPWHWERFSSVLPAVLEAHFAA
jgi:lipoate-protein ligase A